MFLLYACMYVVCVYVCVKVQMQVFVQALGSRRTKNTCHHIIFLNVGSWDPTQVTVLTELSPHS